MSFFVKPSIPPSMIGQPNGLATLDNSGKVPLSQLPSSLLTFEGTWDASTNTPTLADGVGDQGDTYIVTVAGTQDLGHGSILYHVGDYVIYNGSTWLESAGQQANFPLLAPSGDAPIPYSFENNPTSGLWVMDYGSGNIHVITKINNIDVAAVFPQGIRVPDGSASAPSYTFNNDNSSGLYFSYGDSTIHTSIAGNQVCQINGSALQLADGMDLKMGPTGPLFHDLGPYPHTLEIASDPVLAFLPRPSGLFRVSTSQGSTTWCSALHNSTDYFDAFNFFSYRSTSGTDMCLNFNVQGSDSSFKLSNVAGPIKFSTGDNSLGALNFAIYTDREEVKEKLIPMTSSTKTLGDPTHKWNTIYLNAGVFPVGSGTAGQFLQTDGAGTLSWASVPASANLTLSNLQSPVALNQNLTPGSNGVLTSGDPTHRWNRTYILDGYGLNWSSGIEFYHNSADGFAPVYCFAQDSTLNPILTSGFGNGTLSLSSDPEFDIVRLNLDRPNQKMNVLVNGSEIISFQPNHIYVADSTDLSPKNDIATNLGDPTHRWGNLLLRDAVYFGPGDWSTKIAWAANQYSIVNNNTTLATLALRGLVVGPNGGVTAPSIAFANALNSGMYVSDIGGEISLASNGNQCIRLGNTGYVHFPSNTGVQFDPPINLSVGSVSAPALRFTSAVTTGLYLSSGAIRYSKASTDQGEIVATNSAQDIVGPKKFITNAVEIGSSSTSGDNRLFLRPGRIDFNYSQQNYMAFNGDGFTFIGVLNGLLDLSLNNGNTSYRDFKPGTNNQRDLGTSGLKWRSGYFGSSIESPLYYVSAAGSISAPQITRVGDTTLGIWLDSADHAIKFVDSGVENARCSSDGLMVMNGKWLYVWDETNAARVAIRAHTLDGIGYTLDLPTTVGTNGQVLTTNGAGALSWTTPSSGTSFPLSAPDGSGAAPSYSFSSSGSSGLYWYAPQGEMAVSIAGNTRFVVGPNEVDVRDADLYIAKDGTVTDPSLWIGNTNTALFSPAANCLGVACDELEVARFTPTGLDLLDYPLYLGNTQNAWLKYETTNGTLELASQGAAGMAEIGTRHALAVYSHQADNANWEPAIGLNGDGSILLVNRIQGGVDNRKVHVVMDNGVLSATHPLIVCGTDTGDLQRVIQLGYHANGSAVDGAAISTLNSLPLRIEVPSLVITNGSTPATLDWGTWDLFGGLRLDVNGNCKVTFCDYASSTRIESVSGKWLELIQNDSGIFIGSTNHDGGFEMDFSSDKATVYGVGGTQFEVAGNVATPANGEIRMQINSVISAKVTGDSTAGKTRFWLWDNDNATLVQVEVGANDSGGTGYKMLRIPN